jgi:hypothetical protein
MPFGRDYLDALNRFPDNVSPKLGSYKMFKEHHDHEGNPDGWAKNAVEHARQLCLQGGVFARDTVEIRSLRNVFDDVVLMKTAAMNDLVLP